MPFTTPESRKITDSVGPQTVGDRCFIYYREMLRKWKKSMRWTTAHEIYTEVYEMTTPGRNAPVQMMDDVIARRLAWQVFFHRHVMNYENFKAMENGEVETE